MTQQTKITSESIKRDTNQYLENGGTIKEVPARSKEEIMKDLKKEWNGIEYLDDEDFL